MDHIAETLHGEGLNIATSTLKSYLQRAKTKAVKKAPAKALADTPASVTVNNPVDIEAATLIPKPDRGEM